MNKYIKSLLAVAVLSPIASATAQNLETGYFNENYIYRHEMNPAFDNEKNYVAMPFILGNMNVGVYGNLNVKDLIYNTAAGKTTTFLHPEVSADDFLKKIKDRNKIGENFRYQLIGVGFKGIGGYNTIALNVRENAAVVLPGDAFRIAKGGISNKAYDLTNLSAHADAYVELALGHSHKINDQWKVGAKVKFLFGAGNVDVETKTANVELNENGGAKAEMNAALHANVKGIQYKYDKDGKVEGVDKINGAGLGGFGVAFDLGAEYKLDDNWKFSASIIDLGFISWSEDHLATANGTFQTSDFVYNVDDNEFADATGKTIEDKIKAVYQLEDAGNVGGRTAALGATMNLGANYTAPFYDKLNFGLLNTTRIQGKYSWTDFRLSANVRPVKWFSATADLSVGTFGVGFGWMLDFQAKKGIDFFIAMDRTPGKLAKQGIPLNSNAEFSMGINFPF